MASIINKISLQNFFNYYGSYDANTYDFKEGINIVVADNGAGKSKLFNALLWVFYNELLDSDLKIRRNIESMAVKTISDMAKNEVSIGESVDCGVRIEFQDSRFTYQIEKKFSATKISDKGNMTDVGCWEINSYDFEVSRKDNMLLRFKPIFEENEKNEIVKDDGSPYKVYTPFSKKWINKMYEQGIPKYMSENLIENLIPISKKHQISLKILLGLNAINIFFSDHSKIDSVGFEEFILDFMKYIELNYCVVNSSYFKFISNKSYKYIVFKEDDSFHFQKTNRSQRRNCYPQFFFHF